MHPMPRRNLRERFFFFQEFQDDGSLQSGRIQFADVTAGQQSSTAQLVINQPWRSKTQ